MAEKNDQYSMTEKSPKRRLTTDCNYSVFTTLLMRFLKQNDLYKVSRNLAKANRISQEKNYSIIFLRIGLYIFEKMKQNFKKSDAVEQIFRWLQNQIDDCVNSKYRENPQCFRKMVKIRNKELLFKIRRVFEEGDLNCQQNLKNFVIQIYEKKGKRHSKTHEKMANELARLVNGIANDGEKFCYKSQKNEVKIQEISKNQAEQEDSSFAGICANDRLILSTDHEPQLESLCQPQQWNYFGGEHEANKLKEPTPLLDLISSEFIMEQKVEMDIQHEYLFTN